MIPIQDIKLTKQIKSKEDKTIKYNFDIDGQVIEFSYIDNGSNKDIICVPCQTMCNMSCTFCHLTDYVGKIKLNNLHSKHIIQGIDYIVKDLSLGERVLLISYMGCGEALDNYHNVAMSLLLLKQKYDNIRFGLATIIPKKHWIKFFELTSLVKNQGINLKIHLSFHFTNDEDRKKWMPSALEIEPSLDALNFYRKFTGNPTEIHYTIMDKVNDSFEDIDFLSENIHKDTTIKFMMYSEKESLDVQRVQKDKLDLYINYLKDNGSIVEYYEPPGNDIGASCGQFLFD